MVSLDKKSNFADAMDRIEKFLTADGSHSFYLPSIDEAYHSDRGAIQESSHIFIKEGFSQIPKQTIRILEVGFGTGLNVLLTAISSEKLQKNVVYTALEKYPLSTNKLNELNYVTLLEVEIAKEWFDKIHRAPWDKKEQIANNFFLHKRNVDFTSTPLSGEFDLIYFDAFSPQKQPEMWTEEMFAKIYQHTLPDGRLVTYSVKGTVKRALKNVGFMTTKRPGPPGKREILIAHKKI